MGNTFLGSLEVTGSPEAIKEWLDNGMEPLMEGETPEETAHSWYYPACRIKGTIGALVESFNYQKESNTIRITSYEEDGSIDKYGFALLSKKYGVDFIIEGYEAGMQFTQELSIVDGELVSESIEYLNEDDFCDNCLSPKTQCGCYE